MGHTLELQRGAGGAGESCCCTRCRPGFLPSNGIHFDPNPALESIPLETSNLFYNSAITQPLVCARIEVEIGSHLTPEVSKSRVISQEPFLGDLRWVA